MVLVRIGIQEGDGSYSILIFKKRIGLSRVVPEKLLRLRCPYAEGMVEASA